MAMHLPAHDTDTPMLEINTTPLIDVMLVLLVMLIITIPLQTHAVNMQLPNTDAIAEVPQNPDAVITIEVSNEGAWIWNDQALTDRQDLVFHLQQLEQDAPNTAIHLRPHADAPYRQVAAVLSVSQRLGLSRIGLVATAKPR